MRAHTNLAAMFRAGVGVKQDVEKADKLLQAAAMQGCEAAIAEIKHAKQAKLVEATKAAGAKDAEEVKKMAEKAELENAREFIVTEDPTEENSHRATLCHDTM